MLTCKDISRSVWRLCLGRTWGGRSSARGWHPPWPAGVGGGPPGWGCAREHRYSPGHPPRSAGCLAACVLQTNIVQCNSLREQLTPSQKRLNMKVEINALNNIPFLAEDCWVRSSITAVLIKNEFCWMLNIFKCHHRYLLVEYSQIFTW